MNGNATIMLRAVEVLLKSFKTASLCPPPLGGLLYPFMNRFCCRVTALAASAGPGPGAVGKIIQFDDCSLESEAVDFQ